MVKNRHAQRLAQPFQHGGQFAILYAGRHVPARMVVRDNDRLRVGLQRRAEDLAGLDDRSHGRRTERDENRLGKDSTIFI